MKTSLKIFLVLLVISVAVGVTQETKKGKPKGPAKAGTMPQRPPPPVETERVVEMEIGETVSLFGNVHAARSATVRAEVEGAVFAFDKEVGDRVTKGEGVCRIDPEKYRIALNIAEAALESAQAGFEKAKLEEDRMNELYREKVMSLEESQIATLNRKIAEASATSREVEIQRAKRDLRLASVSAPFSGSIAKKYIQKGDWARAGDPVFDIVDLSSVYVSVTLPEKDLSRVSVGSTAVVRLDAYPETEFKGKITRIAPRSSLQSRGFMLRVEFQDPEKIARDGLFARVEVQARKAIAIVVSKDAVVERGPAKMVFKVEKKKVRQINISVLQQMGDMVEVKGDLKAGDEVVVTGNEILRDGAPINVTLRR